VGVLYVGFDCAFCMSVFARHLSPQEWPHDFVLRITYTLNASSLKMTAEVRAPTEDLKMALLFHTYLRVGDIKGTEIVGLQYAPPSLRQSCHTRSHTLITAVYTAGTTRGLNYRPQAPDHAAASLQAGDVCFEQREIVTIAGPTEWVLCFFFFFSFSLSLSLSDCVCVCVRVCASPGLPRPRRWTTG
jgi:galactose mutarotase-like enzyme